MPRPSSRPAPASRSSRATSRRRGWASARTATGGSPPRSTSSTTSPPSTTSRCRSASPSSSTSTGPATYSPSAATSTGCERLNYVSTAYVAGDRTGVVYEHELNLGQGFKNHYESTKFQAEVWVRSAMDEMPTTIFRPAIVVGDSRTGETQKFDGPYYALRFIAASAARGMPVANIGRGATPVQRRPRRLHRRGHGRARAVRGRDRRDPPPLRPGAAQLARDVRPAGGALPGQAGLLPGAPGDRSRRRCGSGRSAISTAALPPQSIRYLNHPVRYDTRRASELLARFGAALSGLQRVRGGDGRLLPRARGRPGVRIHIGAVRVR